MKLTCSISVGNRSLPALAVHPCKKRVNSTLALCKNPNSSSYQLILFSSHSKNGTKYEIKHITKVLTRFVNEGKATLQFTTPPHDLYVQAEPILLKSFLHLLRRVVEGKVLEKELVSSMSLVPSAAKPIQKKLVIQNPSDYPSKGLPRTLESLYINDIRKCSVDRAILQLSRLTILDMSHNCIEYLPVEINTLPCLAELKMSNNLLHKGTLKQWSWLGGNLSKTLKLLDLSSNQLNFLPNQLIKLHALVTFHVDHNELRTLPSGIGNLQQLQVLTASSNCLSALPGSAKKWNLQNLDLYNNAFGTEPRWNNMYEMACCTTRNQVFSLKGLAAQKVLSLRMMYTPETLPRTVIDYLDAAKYCVCGAACFDKYLYQNRSVQLRTVAQTFSISHGRSYVPIICYFCSLKCFEAERYNRIRLPVTR